MSTKHIPGPWTAEKLKDRKVREWVIRAPGNPPCISYELASLSGHDPIHDEANARLIAAAPDLLKVLRMARAKIAAELQVMVMCHTGPDGLIDDAEVVLLIEAEQDLLNQIDAAIAKAEGAA